MDTQLPQTAARPVSKRSFLSVRRHTLHVGISVPGVNQIVAASSTITASRLSALLGGILKLPPDNNMEQQLRQRQHSSSLPPHSVGRCAACAWCAVGLLYCCGADVVGGCQPT